MKRIDFILLTMILTVALLFRLYKINSPLADFHSWRQADTAAVARNFVKDGFDLMHPRYDDLSNVQSGLENPQGYRMVEFPLYNALVAGLYKLFPMLSLEVWGRLTTTIFSLLVIGFIYYLLLKESGRLAAGLATFTYAVFPYFVFFSRVILPETPALGLCLSAIFILYLSAKKKSNYPLWPELLSAILLAMALLVKPTIIFYFLPVLVIFYRKYKLNLVKTLSFYLYLAVAFTPLIYWRFYIKNFPEGIPVSDWLFTSANTSEGLRSIFFRPSFFRWIFFERINNLILGGYLTVFLILGIIVKQRRFLILSFVVSALAYIFTFQGGNLQHEYYQTLILPALAMMVGVGAAFVLSYKKELIGPALMSIAFLGLFGLSFYFSYYKVISFYQYSQELVQEGNIIKSLTGPDDKIVTDRTGDTTLLYLANRRGAPAIYKDPAELKKIGYRYLITSSPEEIAKMSSDFEIVFENEKFTLFRL